MREKFFRQLFTFNLSKHRNFDFMRLSLEVFLLLLSWDRDRVFLKSKSSAVRIRNCQCRRVIKCWRAKMENEESWWKRPTIVYAWVRFTFSAFTNELLSREKSLNLNLFDDNVLIRVCDFAQLRRSTETWAGFPWIFCWTFIWTSGHVELLKTFCLVM